MQLQSAQDLWAFFEELKGETDRGLPLVATALIDELLCEILLSFMCENESAKKLLKSAYAPLGSFSSRIEACHALGLIDGYERSETDLLRKVRNEFAHKRHGLNFSDSKVQGYCATLTSELPSKASFPVNDPRFRFINATVSLTVRFYHRPDLLKRDRLYLRQFESLKLPIWQENGDTGDPSDNSQ